MAGSLNKVMLIGNCGADPEIRRTQDGRPIANLRIATSEQWRDKNTGEKKEHTDWHTVVIFNESLAKVVEQYVRKGAKLYIEGQLKTRKWQDNSGADRYSTEVVLQGYDAKLQMLDGIKGSGYRAGGDGPDDYGMDADRAAGASSGRSTSSQSSNRSPAPASRPDMDDEIPF